MKKVLILFGGNSYEHEISCMSVNFIKDNTDNNLFNYELVGIDFDNNWFIVDKNKTITNNWIHEEKEKIENIIDYLKQFNIVFPMIHGNTGEDGKLQGLFELYDIKYVGCDSYSSLICYDKLLTKMLLEKHDIPQIPYIIYSEKLDIDSINYPVIVKPCKCGSSIGISVVNNKNELLKAIEIAKKYDNNIIIEKYLIKKRELECAILDTKNKLIISDVGEIMNNDNWYDFDSKYKTKTDTNISNIDVKIKEQIQKYSKEIFNTLKCKHYSRLDFFYDIQEKKLYFNEINTIPGFTEISMYPKLIINSGINPKELLTLLLNI